MKDNKNSSLVLLLLLGGAGLYFLTRDKKDEVVVATPTPAPTPTPTGLETNQGCMNPSALNYDSTANQDDGSCEYSIPPVDVLGCTDASADNYNMDANVDDGSCSFTVLGCTDPEADNYVSSANTDDGSCNYYEPIFGCMDETAFNYDQYATEDNGSCSYPVLGCTDSYACNFQSVADTDDGSCLYAEEGYDCNSNCLNDADGDLICDEDEILGCTNSMYDNYNPDATEDDGSCYSEVVGCTDSSASNFNPNANVDDGTCVYPYGGCLDANAENYDSGADFDNGSCSFAPADEEQQFLEYVLSSVFYVNTVSELDDWGVQYMSPFFGATAVTDSSGDIITGVNLPIQYTIDEMFSLPVGVLCVQTGNNGYNGAPVYSDCMADSNNDLQLLYDEFLEIYDAGDFDDNPIDDPVIVISEGATVGKN